MTGELRFLPKWNQTIFVLSVKLLTILWEGYIIETIERSEHDFVVSDLVQWLDRLSMGVVVVAI